MLPLFNRMSWKSYLLTKTNQYSILVVYFILMSIAIIVRLPYLFAVSLFVTVVVAGSLFLDQNKTKKFWVILLSQITIIPILIFFYYDPCQIQTYRNRHQMPNERTFVLWQRILGQRWMYKTSWKKQKYNSLFH